MNSETHKLFPLDEITPQNREQFLRFENLTRMRNGFELKELRFSARKMRAEIDLSRLGHRGGIPRPYPFLAIFFCCIFLLGCAAPASLSSVRPQVNLAAIMPPGIGNAPAAAPQSKAVAAAVVQPTANDDAPPLGLSTPEISNGRISFYVILTAVTIKPGQQTQFRWNEQTQNWETLQTFLIQRTDDVAGKWQTIFATNTFAPVFEFSDIVSGTHFYRAQTP